MTTWTLMDSLTDVLARPRMGEQKEPNFYPSEATAVYENEYGEEVIAGKCRRAAFFRLVKDWYDFDPESWQHMQPLAEELERKEIPFDKYTYWVFEAGNIFERHIKNMTKKAGVFVEEEVPVFLPNPRVSGRIDIIVLDYTTNKLNIVEVKSIYGHNTTSVFGNKKSRFKPMVPGEPRDSHLMQTGFYQWRFAMHRDDFGPARLCYGARDKGTYGEFLVRIGYNEATNSFPIEYKQVLPMELDWVTSPITINSMLRDGYEYVQNHLETGVIPPRDFELMYSPDKIATMYERGELDKASEEKYEKLMVLELRERVDAGETLSAEEQELHDRYDGKRIKKDQKPVEKDDWQCRLCKWKDICYDANKQPTAL